MTRNRETLSGQRTGVNRENLQPGVVGRSQCRHFIGDAVLERDRGINHRVLARLAARHDLEPPLPGSHHDKSPSAAYVAPTTARLAIDEDVDRTQSGHAVQHQHAGVAGGDAEEIRAGTAPETGVAMGAETGWRPEQMPLALPRPRKGPRPCREW